MARKALRPRTPKVEILDAEPSALPVHAEHPPPSRRIPVVWGLPEGYTGVKLDIPPECLPFITFTALTPGELKLYESQQKGLYHAPASTL
jgi:hypothetical protein